MPVGLKRFLQLLLALILIAVGLVTSLILLAFFTQYRPREIMPVQITEANTGHKVQVGKEYSLITWNMGHGALGEEQTFFMGGGTGSGAETQKEVEDNLAAMTRYIKRADVDFVLLQEVDKKAMRSFNINQVSAVQLSGYSSSFAINHKVLFVPAPLLSPMGNVESGLVTLSKASPDTVFRHAFDGKEKPLQQLFAMDRCFTVSRYPTDTDKELVLLNAHFSTFNTDGYRRERQLAQMKSFLEKEYRKGNYVILGGDFNHELPETDAYHHTWVDEYPSWLQTLPASFVPMRYHWGVDKENPTCRSVEKPYVPGESFVYTSDGFLVSDTIEIQTVRSRYDFGFEHTNHSPVEIRLRLLSPKESTVSTEEFHKDNLESNP